MSDWVRIDGFPRYLINERGEVLDSDRGIMSPFQVTGGALCVKLLNENNERVTKSIKNMVAQHFVNFDFDPEYIDMEQFNSTILLDNDQTNVSASNIRWRPRWFVWQYTHQFNAMNDWYYKGPLRCHQTDVYFMNVFEVGIHYGLLFKDIYEAANEHERDIYSGPYTVVDLNGNEPRPVWPIQYSFSWVK